VLRAGGVWLWVDGGRLTQHTLWARLTDWSFRVTTGDSAGLEPLLASLQGIGFTASRQLVAPTHRSHVWLIVAEKV